MNKFFVHIFTIIVILLLATGANAYTYNLKCGQTLRDSRSGNYYKAPPCPTPIPTPSPTPAPVIGKVVAKDGSGNYTSIVDGLVGISAGQTLWVKDGIYNEYPIITKASVTLKAYPGAKPVLDCGLTKPASYYSRIEIKAENVTVEGFEVRRCWDGIKVYKDGTVLRNNNIHDNLYQGILAVSVNNLLMEGNRSASNGKYCEGWPNALTGTNISPRHCHGIYVSNYVSACKDLSGIKVYNNFLEDNPGHGFQVNGEGCPDNSVQVELKGNTIKNNGAGMVMYRSGTFASKADVRGNNFICETYPVDSDFSVSDHNCISIWGLTSYINSDVLNVNTFIIASPFVKIRYK